MKMTIELTARQRALLLSRVYTAMTLDKDCDIKNEMMAIKNAIIHADVK